MLSMKKKCPTDYKFLKLIGEGSFSSVYLAVSATQQQPAPTGLNVDGTRANGSPIVRKYAIKVCQKQHIRRQGKHLAIMREKQIMNILNDHPNEHFLKLYCTFQDVERLYFVMTYAKNGELLSIINRETLLPVKIVRLYTLQITEALEHMHKLGIVHRDLKPENILLDEKMNILITDFGSAQVYPIASDKNGVIHTNNDQTKTTTTNTATESNCSSSVQMDRKNSFVGTAQYVSPEMLKSRSASNKSDLWAFGVIIYQMLANALPFSAVNEYLIYRKIMNLDFQFSSDFNEDAKDLVKCLLRLEPNERLGAKDSEDLHNNGYVSIRKHKFLYPLIDRNKEEMLSTLLQHFKQHQQTATNAAPTSNSESHVTSTTDRHVDSTSSQSPLTTSTTGGDGDRLQDTSASCSGNRPKMLTGSKDDEKLLTTAVNIEAVATTNYSDDTELIGSENVQPGLDERRMLQLLSLN